MIIELLNQFIEKLLYTISALGYPGIAILMAIESSIIPLPSEAVLIPAGVLVAHGEMNASIVIIAAVVGSVLGALCSYYIAFRLGRAAVNHLVAKYGRLLLLDVETMYRTERYFAQHGEITTFVGRLLPVVRHLISIPAGFGRMPLLKFTCFTALGATIWSIILVSIGYFIGENATRLHTSLNLITWISIGSAFIILIVYLFFRKR